MAIRKKPRQIERGEQEALIEWFRLRWPGLVLASIPNGLVRNSYQAASAVRGGLVPGMPDLFLAVPRGAYCGMFVELKRPGFADMKAGELSIAQANMLRYLRAMGYFAIVAYGWVDASRQIDEYLSMREHTCLN